MPTPALAATLPATVSAPPPLPGSVTPRHVVVLGAGIVGLASAWHLAQAGHQVTVVDRATPGQAGSGTSGANGAQLSYAYVQPLADPGIWRQLPRLLLAADSPLKLRVQPDPWQWAWGLRFLAACRASVSQRSTAQLLKLAATSRSALEAFFAHPAVRQATPRGGSLGCDFSATGKLVLYQQARDFAGAQHQLHVQRQLGGPAQQALSPSECVAVEPALAHYAPHIAGGIYTPGECAIDCLQLCQLLERLLRQQGVRFVQGQAVGWVREPAQSGPGQSGHRERLRGVRLAPQADRAATTVQADAFVLALGTGSPALVRPLGLQAAWQVPVYPLKGYSLTLPLADGAQQSAHLAPQVSITDAARKVVFARLGQRLRVAGMAELTGQDWSIHPQRIASLHATARDLFPNAANYTTLPPSGETWAGLRPASPTGVPVVGRLPGAPDNLLLNTGHGALGLTLAFGTGQQIAQLF